MWMQVLISGKHYTRWFHWVVAVIARSWSIYLLNCFFNLWTGDVESSSQLTVVETQVTPQRGRQSTAEHEQRDKHVHTPDFSFDCGRKILYSEKTNTQRGVCNLHTERCLIPWLHSKYLYCQVRVWITPPFIVALSEACMLLITLWLLVLQRSLGAGAAAWLGQTCGQSHAVCHSGQGQLEKLPINFKFNGVCNGNLSGWKKCYPRLSCMKETGVRWHMRQQIWCALCIFPDMCISVWLAYFLEPACCTDPFIPLCTYCSLWVYSLLVHSNVVLSII